MAKKKFDVLVNITVATTIEDVEAENEKQAETIVDNYIGDNWEGYVRQAEMYVDSEVVEVNEQDGGEDTDEENDVTSAADTICGVCRYRSETTCEQCPVRKTIDNYRANN